MKMYLFSFGVGLIAGAIYGMLSVRSPAPPVIALIGLLGMLIGEQLMAAAKRSVSDRPVTLAWIKSECAGQILEGHPIEGGTEGRNCTPSGTDRAS